MKDDIVKRLMFRAVYRHEQATANLKMANYIEWEAANEIERLREQVRQLEAERDQWQRLASQ